MSMEARRALSAYQQVEVDTKVSEASPHQLIAMLYDAAQVAIMLAKAHMQNKDIGEKGKAISKAISVIDEGLKVSLNEEAGGELAQNLAALYDYMTLRLLHANLKNDEAALDEVLALVNELKSAWSGMLQVGEVEQA